MKDTTSLKNLKAGETGKIIRLSKEAKPYRQKLLAMGLTKNTVIKVLRVAPLGDPIEIEVRGFSLSLRKQEAEQILMHRETHE